MSFKKRAPRAIKEIRKFAEKAMVCVRFINWGHCGVCYNGKYAYKVPCDRVHTTYDLTHSSIRRSGNRGSRAFHFAFVCASRESVTMKRMRRRSCTAMYKQ